MSGLPDSEGVTQREFQRALDVLKDSMRKMEELAIERDTEIKRRLVDLNHSAERMAIEHAQSVPRELYERDITTAREALAAAMESNRQEVTTYRRAQEAIFTEYQKAQREKEERVRDRREDIGVAAKRFNVHAVFGYGLAFLMAVFTIWQALKK